MNMSGAVIPLCLDAFWALLDNHSFLLFDVAFDHADPCRCPLLSVCILMHFDCWCALRIFGTWKCIDEKLSHFTIFRLNTSWHEKRGNTAQTCWNRSELSELINAPNEWIKWQNASGAGCWPGNWVCASAAQYLNVTTAVRRRLYCFTWKIYFLKYSSGKWVITATQSIVSAHAVNYFPT